MEEIWKQIIEYPNYYISNTGLVKRKNKILKPYIEKKGYKIISLWNGKEKIFRIHRLVAIHFLPNPNNYPQVNHKDGNKLNNNIDNLEWCNASQNLIHAYKIGLRISKKGQDKPTHKLTEKDVYEIFNLLKQGVLQKDIAKKFNVKQNTICQINKRKRWKHLDLGLMVKKV